MPDFEVRWQAPGAAPQRARVSAPDAGAVAAALGVPAGQLLSVRPQGAGAAPVGRSAAGMPAAAAGPRPAVGPAPLSARLLAQELSVLLQAGVPLLQALEALHEQEPRPAAARVLAALQTGLRDGQPLSQAMQAQPAVFDALFVALVRANERGGTLAEALAQQARFLAWREGLAARVGAALVYPALLLLAGLGVTLFLLLFVLPRFAGLFEDGGVALPAASRQLFALGAALSAQPLWLAPLALLLLALAAGALHRPWRARLLRQGQGLAWRLPGLGPRLRVLALATVYRALGVLLGSGVPALAALRLTADLAAPPLQPGLRQAAEAVGQGQRLSDALQQAGLATPVARRMVRVGEHSGELAAMLARAAGFHDEEIERLAAWVSQALTPLLMLAMAVLVGGLVVLMYLPIFDLMEQVR